MISFSDFLNVFNFFSFLHSPFHFLNIELSLLRIFILNSCTCFPSANPDAVCFFRWPISHSAWLFPHWTSAECHKPASGCSLQVHTVRTGTWTCQKDRDLKPGVFFVPEGTGFPCRLSLPQSKKTSFGSTVRNNTLKEGLVWSLWQSISASTC